jgi:AbrB family looped-hinge helix DNA binding protein
MDTAKITSKGQITIPVEIRKKLGVDTGDQLVFIEKDGAVMIVKADNINALARCQRYLEEFQKYEK